MTRKESTELASQWFSKYLNVIISDREAREFVAQLRDAIKDLHRVGAIVADENSHFREYVNAEKDGKGTQGGNAPTKPIRRGLTAGR